MGDIENIEDIKTFVDAFYSKARIDPLLGPVFSSRFNDADWLNHLDRMYSFWNTALFSVPGYKGSPFGKHIGLRIGKEHFDRWTELFKTVIDNNFQGSFADDVKIRAEKMATVFYSKIEYMEANPNYKPLA